MTSAIGANLYRFNENGKPDSILNDKAVDHLLAGFKKPGQARIDMSASDQPETNGDSHAAFCIFIDTLCEGRVPLVTDGEGRYLTFDTELEAQKEIADDAMTRLQQFMDGERDFDDAITVEEYILPVTVHPDGSFTDEAGKTHGPKAP